MSQSPSNPDDTTDVGAVGGETTDIDATGGRSTDIEPGTETTDIDTSGVPILSAPPSVEVIPDDTGTHSTDTGTPPYLPPRRSAFGPLWEHQILYTDFELVDESRLNAYGDERWELMSMVQLPNERFQFVFRRSR
jgi:hypothetical protein